MEYKDSLAAADIGPMAEDTLNLAVGATVQLQLTLPENSPRDMVRVIGYLPGASLVVTTPTNNGSVKIVREGQSYRVRMLRGDSVVGFEAKVLSVSLKPYPHMHLQYPREFSQIIVRNSARVSANIACKVRNTTQPDLPENYLQARIVDLSESGAKVSSPVPLGKPAEMLQLNFELDILGQKEAMTLVGDLMNRRERKEDPDTGTPGLHLHGIQFKAVNRFQQVVLHAWVMEQIVTGAGSMG